MNNDITMRRPDDRTISRRRFVAAAGAFAIPLALRAQQPPGHARIGVLAGTADLAFRDLFTRTLRDLGWNEGKNLVIDWRSSTRPEEVAALAADLVRQKPHVVVTGGPQLTRADTNKQYVEAGGLASFGTNVQDQFRRAADYVDRILRGAKPADLPVQEPTHFQLAVNLSAAREQGIKFPRSILLRADQVIE